GHTRLYRLVGMFIPYLHLVVVILKIGTVGICPQVAPLPYHSIAQVAIVCLIAVGKENNIVQLSPYLAARPQGGSAIYFGTHLQHTVVAHSQRAADQYPFQHHYIFSYIYRPCSRIDDAACIDLRALFYKDILPCYSNTGRYGGTPSARCQQAIICPYSFIIL